MSDREIVHENVSVSDYAGQLDAVARLSGIDRKLIKGYALLVDDGSRQAVVTTDLDLPEVAALLYQVTGILLGSAS
jgi:hypothetical protein